MGDPRVADPGVEIKAISHAGFVFLYLLTIKQYMKTSALFIFTLFFAVAAHSQTTINNYKYVLVPQRFDFSKTDDQYGMNTSAKWLLEQKGFVVFWVNKDLPPTLAADKCIALRAEVVQRKAMFTTNLTLLLKDCQGNVIFKSKEGKSREKEFEAAYYEALKDAFSSLNAEPYKYDSTLSPQRQQVSTASQPLPTASQPLPAASQPVASSQPVTAQPQPVTTSPAVPSAAPASGTLYAQAIPNGYQLIDTSPKKVLTLLKTSIQDCFLDEAPGSNGVVFKIGRAHV